MAGTRQIKKTAFGTKLQNFCLLSCCPRWNIGLRNRGRRLVVRSGLEIGMFSKQINAELFIRKVLRRATTGIVLQSVFQEDSQVHAAVSRSRFEQFHHGQETRQTATSRAESGASRASMVLVDTQ